MAIIRIKHLNFEETFKVPEGADTLNTQEWFEEDTNRVKEAGWNSRYDYEAQLIASLASDKLSTVLEIGAGPGVLNEKIQNILSQQGYELKYDLVDKPFAKEAFTKAERKGIFFVKDISNGLDVTGLRPEYNLIIANDVLEHLFNPSEIVQKIHSLLSKEGTLFVSVPNWRMGHQFIYRGLFDYDNFLYFMKIHKFTPNSVYPSPLQTPDYPKLDSEETMDEELRRSWNWYFTFTPDK